MRTAASLLALAVIGSACARASATTKGGVSSSRAASALYTRTLHQLASVRRFELHEDVRDYAARNLAYSAPDRLTFTYRDAGSADRLGWQQIGNRLCYGASCFAHAWPGAAHLVSMLLLPQPTYLRLAGIWAYPLRDVSFHSLPDKQQTPSLQVHRVEVSGRGIPWPCPPGAHCPPGDQSLGRYRATLTVDARSGLPLSWEAFGRRTGSYILIQRAQFTYQ